MELPKCQHHYDSKKEFYNKQVCYNGKMRHISCEVNIKKGHCKKYLIEEAIKTDIEIMMGLRNEFAFEMVKGDYYENH